MAGKIIKKKTGGTYCCLPECNSSSMSGGKLYKIPTKTGRRNGQSTAKWAEEFHQVVFRYRHDPKFKRKVLTGKAFICSKHFKDCDVLTLSKKSFIKFGCLPTTDLPAKSHESETSLPRRPILKYKPDIAKKNIILSVRDMRTSWKPSAVPGWRFHDISEESVHLTCWEDKIYACPRVSLVVEEAEGNGSLKLSAAFKGVAAEAFSSALEFGSRTLPEMLQYLADISLCMGYASVPASSPWSLRTLAEVEGNEVVYEKRFFSDGCEVVARRNVPVCNACMAVHVKCVANHERRLKRQEEMAGVPLNSNAPLSSCNAGRLSSTVIHCRQSNRNLEKELSNHGLGVSENLEGIIKDLSDDRDDTFLREWWTVQRKLRKGSSSYGRRYPPSVIRYCLSLYAKSPSAYRLVQQIMVLPSARTLRAEKMQTLNRCQTGLQNGAATRIRQCVDASENFHEQLAVISIDEMTIKEDLIFQTSRGNVIGFVDYNNEDINNLSRKSNNVASHVLAVYVRGVTNNKIDGVVAYYPTSGVSADDLFLLLSRLLVEIPKITKVTIIGVVCDGLPANRSVMKLLCRQEDDGSLPYRMENPVDTSRYIYFVPDPPHLLKTARNSLLNRCMWNNGLISAEPVKQLIKEDIARGTLRYFPQLSESHLNPSTWQKMNVKMAAQTLSSTLGTELAATSPALSLFLLNMDKWFDAMNAGYYSSMFKPSRRPYYDPKDERLNWLEGDFLNYLYEWRSRAYARPLVGDVNRSLMLLTAPTEEGLIVATKSMVAIVRESLEYGADYVLSRRINQDSLEAYFGQQRNRVSRGDAPSVGLFSANARSVEVMRRGHLPGANVQLRG